MCSQNATFCENCGNLITTTHPPLYGSTTEKLAKVPHSSLIASLILDDDLITLLFQNEFQQVHVDTKLFLGRGIPTELQLPVLDLTPVAFVGGISRLHAIIVPIVRGKYQIMDVGSTNGTFIDRRRLAAFRLYYLGDESELALGNLHMKVQYAAPSHGDNAFVSTLVT
jgi:hypothetical protein